MCRQAKCGCSGQRESDRVREDTGVERRVQGG